MNNLVDLPVRELPTIHEVSNPYRYLIEPHLIDILRNRDLALQTSIEYLPQFLNDYDKEVDSSYLERLLNSNYNTLTNKAEIFLIASLKGAPINRDYQYLASPDVSIHYLKGHVLSTLVWLSLPPGISGKIKFPRKEERPIGRMMRERQIHHQSNREGITTLINLPTENIVEFLNSAPKNVPIDPEKIPQKIKHILSSYSSQEQVNILMGLIQNPIKHIKNSVYWSLWLYPMTSFQNNPTINMTSPIKYLTTVFNRPEMIFYLTRGFLSPPYRKEYEKKMARYNYLNESAFMSRNRQEDSIKIDLMFNLYQINTASRENPVSHITIMTYQNVNPFEKFILQPRIQQALNHRQVTEIGMVIPPTLSPNFIPNYYYQNILDYQDVYNLREEKYRHLIIEEKYLGDQEILDRYGIYVPYQSRKHLLEYIEDLKTKPKFFYPSKRKCSNDEFLTTLESTRNPNIFTIAYGTLNNYFCFDKEDIMMSFVDGEIVYFRNLLEPHRVYKREDIDNLLELYKRFPKGNSDVITYLEKSLDRFNRVHTYDEIVLQNFNQLKKEDKMMIKELLYDIFYLGMYMRRWKGFGKPYPLNQESTRISYDPENNILMSFDKIRKHPITSEMGKFLDSLRIVNREGSPTERFLMKQLKIIELSEENVIETCIRINSSRIIYTIYYILQNLYNEKIPGFNLSNFEEIQ